MPPDFDVSALLDRVEFVGPRVVLTAAGAESGGADGIGLSLDDCPPPSAPGMPPSGAGLDDPGRGRF